MSDNHKFDSLGLEVPLILLPQSSASLDLARWPVIACDQFTQDAGYWEKAKEAAAGFPSTLNLIFPEVFLTGEGADKKIADIHSTMNSYLKDGIFSNPQKGFIYIERDTPFQRKRRGLVAAIDLEQYDWYPQARPLIRSTEGTVAERLPARMDIRRGAPLELPHVLLLIDDDSAKGNDTDSLLVSLGEKVKNTDPSYSTQLMLNSGSVTGWLLNEEKEIAFIAGKLDELLRRSITRYGEGKPFLFAVGDGNHSLAAAKGIWEEIKASYSGKELPCHPCRYALVEIENIYDPAIQFEPIHRLVFDISFDDAVSLLSQLPDFFLHPFNDAQELSRAVKNGWTSNDRKAASNCFGIISGGRYALIETSASGIATASLQPLLDIYAKDNPLLIDYIHDEAELFRLSDENSHKTGTARKTTGILLPPVQKSGLFDTVARLGPLPRKSFSMGHSVEKRFYMECRALF